ncbi:MAG TPA: TetR/AcrR family transcriptional regulator [Jatrophihabitans sp.]|jgi:AcrR family transcriptional regulator|nr:TetR/AcrR family transcriptional regulator [Jatrophihabitans sp.]
MDAATITDAALETMGEVGLDRLTMRAVAARLGVHVGGLYYYLPDKTTLLRSMADQICLQIIDALAPTGDWRVDALDLCHATRRTLLERRDATRVFAQSPVVASVGALGLIERLLELLATGIKPDRVAAAADTLLSYVTGFTLQEQIGTDIQPLDPRLIANGPALFPRMFAALGCDPEITFATALQAILAGFESQAPLTPTGPAEPGHPG